MKPLANLLLSLCALAPLAGCCCLVGPNYHQPPAPVCDQWNQPLGSGLTGDAVEDVAWWGTFRDPVLDNFVARSASGNLSLREAGMRVVAARALRGIVRGELFPDLNSSTTYTRRQQSLNGNPFGFPLPGAKPKSFDLFTAGFDGSWEIDFFGRLRRAVEAANAEVGVAAEDYNGVLVALLAETATTYVDLRTFQARIGIAYENAGTQERTLQLTQDRFKAGDVGELDVAQARANLMNTRATIPPLEAGLQQAKNRLCVLQGICPQDIDRDLGGVAPIPTASHDVAVGVPAELLRRRPEIRSAERAVAAQNARIGVAKGDWYPIFTLTGTVGVVSTDITRLFTSQSLSYNLGPSATWNIFSFGRILNNVRQQEALLDQAIFHYQNVVLLAAEETEAGMVGFVREKQRAAALTQAVAASRRSVELAGIQYKAGLINFQTVLDTQRALLVLQEQLAISQGEVARRVILIYRSLGGGWQSPGPIGVPQPALLPVEPVEPGKPVEKPEPLPPAA